MPVYSVPTSERDNWQEKLLVRVLGSLLNTQVWALRLDKGYGLYNPSASGKYDRNLKQYEFRATLECTPEEYPLLRQEFQNIIRILKTEKVSEDVLQGTVQKLQNLYQGSANTHRFLQNKLYYHIRDNEVWMEEEDFLQYLGLLTPEDILNAAKKYFKPDYFYEFVMTD